MKSTKRKKRKSLGEEVYEAIRKAILHGSLIPGERLIEETMADKFDASRTPVREAFLKLEQEGLVEKRSKGGFVVGSIDLEKIEEIMDLRSVLEGYAAARAARRSNAELIHRLREMLSRYDDAMRSDDIQKMIELNTEFHDLLYKASASRKLTKILEELRDYFYRFRGFILDMEGMDEESHQDHVEMVKAIAKGNSEEAERLVRDHINRAKAALIKEATRGRLNI